MRETTILLGLSIALLISGALYLYLEDEAATVEGEALQAVNLEEFSLYMHRLGCVPGCTSYAVLAKGSGEIEFEGVANVAQSGSVSGSLTDAQLQQLFIEVHRSGLLQAAADLVQGTSGCHDAVPNLDRLTFGVTLDGTTKVITYYTGCEQKWPALEKLGERIDEILNTRRWTEVAGNPQAG